MKDKTRKKKTRNKKRALFSLLFVFLILVSFVTGYLVAVKSPFVISGVAPSNVKNANSGNTSGVDFSLFWQAWNEVTKNYVGDLKPQDMLYGAINGMAAATGDPYTVFFKPEDNKKFQEDIAGQFTGIGIEVELVNSLTTIVTPLSGSPAEKAGLKGKDVILEVDGQKTSDLGFEATINKIRGEKGTTVKLKVKREESSDPMEFSIVRDTIKVNSVESSTVEVSGKKIYYIKVRQFGDNTNELFKKAADNYKTSGAESIVLDLRNNPGGYLNSAVTMASYFLDGGIVVSEVDKDGTKKDFKTDHQATLKDAKVVVLVNEGSASAAEILAGAIKDRNRGKIVGKKSFGKGSVQIFEELSNNSAIKITVAKWLTPNGTAINGIGINPDIEVEDVQNAEIAKDPVIVAGVNAMN